MQIERIKILNFGPFNGQKEIVFSGDGGGVHLIRGDNGQGKTSIQRAILWNLYGKVVDRKGQEIRATSLVNREAVRQDIYQMAVTLYFNHDGAKWSIFRKMQAHSHDDKKYQSGRSVAVSKDGEPQPNGEQQIQRILPYEVSRFFFFDGEMLRDYEELLDQTSQSTAFLRDSIERVLGIPYLRTAREDLYAVQKSIEGERAKLLRRLGGSSYDELVEQYLGVSEEINAREDQIKQIQKDMVRLRAEIAEKKRRLADIHSVQEAANERLALEAKIAGLTADRDRELMALKQLTSQVYKSILSKPANEIISRLDAKHQASMAKYDQKQRMLERQDQLEQAKALQKCQMCGTVLDPAKLAETEASLREVKLRIQSLTEVPEPNLEYEGLANRLRQMVSVAPERIKFKDIETRMLAIEHQLASHQAKLNDVKERLIGVEEDEPRKLEMSIQDFSEQLGTLRAREEAEKIDLDLAREVKRELDQKISGINQAELTVLAKRIETIKAAAEVFDGAVSAYRDERRADVESAATGIFRLIRTKESFARLAINNQFGLNIVTEDGTVLDRAEWRSSGEEQIVALALIGALNRCAQVKAPVFMDTPFGRLDTKHGKRVLAFLPNLADQVVLLVTDREFHKGDERFLEGKIRSDFTVTYRGEKEGAFVNPTTT